MNQECQQCCLFLRYELKLHHRYSFCVHIVLHIVFFRPGSCSQTFGKPKRNLDSLLSVEKNKLSLFSAWFGAPFELQVLQVLKRVLPIFLRNHDLQRPSGLYHLLTQWVVLLLPSQLGETHEGAPVWHQSKITPMKQ